MQLMNRLFYQNREAASALSLGGLVTHRLLHCKEEFQKVRQGMFFRHMIYSFSHPFRLIGRLGTAQWTKISVFFRLLALFYNLLGA